MSDATKRLEEAVEAVDWARNSGNAQPTLADVDELVEAARAVLGEMHRAAEHAARRENEFTLGARLADWHAVLDAFRKSLASGFTWSRGDVARALHRLDRQARTGGDGNV
jgi:hypothetical protein